MRRVVTRHEDKGIWCGRDGVAHARSHVEIEQAHTRLALRQEEVFMTSWNSRRSLAGAVFGAALLALVGSALGAGGKGGAGAKIVIKGGDSFKPNAYIKNTFHFDP